MSDFLNTRHGEALYQAKLRAQESLEQARVNYQDVLGVGKENNLLNPDGRFALRQAGRAYAQAVVEHSNAVMAWLRFVDLQIEDQQQRAAEPEAGTNHAFV